MASVVGEWNQGNTLNCIKAMYACDSAAVKSTEGIGAVFKCYMGVKQGCPLSPNLFGLFIDALEKVMLQLPNKGAMPKLDTGKAVPLLMFADDLLVLSTSPEGLQEQLDALQGFCAQRKLTVNTTKTKVVVLSRIFLNKQISCTMARHCNVIADSNTWVSLLMHMLGSLLPWKKGVKLQAKHFMH